jgi:hypothetical protein
MAQSKTATIVDHFQSTPNKLLPPTPSLLLLYLSEVRVLSSTPSGFCKRFLLLRG